MTFDVDSMSVSQEIVILLELKSEAVILEIFITLGGLFMEKLMSPLQDIGFAPPGSSDT
jgi:hypothetical protein